MHGVECLDANAVQDLMSGALNDVARTAVLGHLDACDECREVVAVMATDAAGDIALGVTLAHGDSAHSEGFERGTVFIPGTALGRYTLETRLGEGAMGVVWRARDPKLGRQVALKLLKRRDAARTQQLISEAQAMARLSHPNVVSVYDVGVADGTTYIAMELVSGCSLRDWRAAAERTVPEIVATFIAAGRGLSAAHAAGIVHRDFKPDNVLVGDDGRVCVSDFGLAARARDNSLDLEATREDAIPPGAVLGTPAYMAPEQFSGGNVDPRTDQFSFCASLYEALYGERPFSGRTFYELADNVATGRMSPVPKHREVSRSLRAIAMRGVSAKPGDRFPSMAHVLAELGRDRARPWRRATAACAVIAGTLALGLGADAVVRTRVAIQIQQSFELTGKQLDRTAKRLSEHFHDVSAIAYREPALRDVAGHHDQADFLLGPPSADQEELERLHHTLVATDWAKVGTSQRAIVDYKGRLLYTSYAPQLWNTDMRGLPPIKRALDDGKGDSVTVLSTTDRSIIPTGLLGHHPEKGLVVMFARVLALGDSATDRSEARAIYLELEDARQVLEELRLDDKTLLAIIGNDGTTVSDSDLPPSLVTAAPRDGGIATVTHAGHSFQIQSRALHGLDGTGQIARVVMARRLDGVLQLFPNARLVFTVAALTALAAAAATAKRARQIAGPRVV